MSSNDVVTLCRALISVKSSLREDVNTNMVARKAAGLLDLDLEPWMVGRYLDGSRPVHASDLLEDASGRVLRQRESLAVRDSMCLQLVLQNAKRGGDVTHIRAEDLEGYGELTVHDHKEERSGKSCYVRVTARLLVDLVHYRDRIRAPSGMPWLFLTRSGAFIQPSAMSKLVEAEWQRHSASMCIPLPRLTASKNRKLAITIHREGGATRDEQVALAKHMAHSVSTADKYYDKSDQREARHHCLNVIHNTINLPLVTTLWLGHLGCSPLCCQPEEDPIHNQSLVEMYESSKTLYVCTSVPQSLENNRKVLCGGRWKKVAMVAPVWRNFKREEVVCEFGGPNRYWRADEAGKMVRQTIENDLDDGEVDDAMDEKEEEAYEAFPVQNSYWKANEAGTMIRQRGAWGLELEDDGEPAIENAPCYENSYWKGDGMELQRGARDLELFEGRFILDPQEGVVEEEEECMEEDLMEENFMEIEEGPKSGMDEFGGIFTQEEEEEEDEDEDRLPGETYISFYLRKQRKTLKQAWKAEIESEEASDGEDPDYLPREGEEEEERHDHAQKAERARPRTRRPATKRHREVTGRRVACQVPECKGLVANIRRHMRLCHPDIQQEVPRNQTRVYERKECAKCGVVTTRLDLHLKRIHGMVKGQELVEGIAAGISRRADTPAMVALSNCLSDYKKKLTSRRSSAGRSSGTVDTQLTAVRFFLSELSSDSVKQLELVGDAGDVIDRELQKGTRLPGTLRLYLSSLVRFLEWVSGSGTWLRHLRMSSNEIMTLCRAVISVKGSLREDVNMNMVARKAAGLLDLDIEPWMVGRYLDGSRPVHASDLLEDAAGRVLKQRESLAVRDSLCLQLVLQNAKRGGDVTHIRAEDLDRVEIKDGYGELTVYDHKEARSGKSCYVRVTARLLVDLVLFRDKVRAPSGMPWLFLTKAGAFIQPSAMSKLVEAEWQRHSVTMGIPLPRLTASKNRKLAITVHREGGATREEQVALAKHMAHSVVTADKYYDKSDQREARHHCLDAIHHTIRSSAGDHAVAGPSGLLPPELSA